MLQGLHSFIQLFAEIVPNISHYQAIRLFDSIASIYSLKVNILVGGSEFSDVVFSVQDCSTLG